MSRQMTINELADYLIQTNPQMLKGINSINQDKTLMLKLIKKTHANCSSDAQDVFSFRGQNLHHDYDFLVDVALIDMNILIQDQLIQKYKSKYIIEILMKIIQKKTDVLNDSKIYNFFKRDSAVFFACLWSVYYLNHQNPQEAYHHFLKLHLHREALYLFFESSLALIGSLACASIINMPLALGVGLLLVSFLMITSWVAAHVRGKNMAFLFKPEESKENDMEMQENPSKQFN